MTTDKDLENSMMRDKEKPVMLRIKTDKSIRTKGRAPRVWNEHRLKQAYELALLGVSDERMAVVMGVNVNTISYWKRTNPRFLSSYMAGKDPANANVARHFYLNCIDRYVKEQIAAVNTKTGKVVKVWVKKFLRGDKWAQKQWLATKLKDIWAESQGNNPPPGNVININNMNAFSGLSTELIREIKKLQQMKGLIAHDNDQDQG